jgi:ATP-dependent Clp protease ATP-binding subunit ClpB
MVSLDTDCPLWSLANDAVEVEKASEDGVGVILFIDELHLIMAGKGSEGGGMDAANLLKPQLARGKVRVIGATTLAEYSKYIEKDAAFERRFAQVIVNEPNVTDTSKYCPR